MVGIEGRRVALTVAAGALLLALACAKPPPTLPRVAMVPAPPPPAPEPPPEAALPAVDAELLMARNALGDEAAARLDDDAREAIAREVADAERQYGLPTLLMLALIEQESLFNPRAIGPRGSIGLMQIRPFVARDVAARHGIPFEGRKQLFDPATNVRIGTGYMAELHGLFGSYELALAAYNKGPTRVRRDLLRGQKPGRRFVERVMTRYERYRARYELPSVSAAE